MSDTPETDAAWKEGNAIREWTCRKLERERNDARDMVEKLTEQGLRLMDDNMMLKREIKKLKKKYE